MHPKNKAGTIPWGASTDGYWWASTAVGGGLRPAGDLRWRGAAAGIGASTTGDRTHADVEGGGARRPGGGSPASGLLRQAAGLVQTWREAELARAGLGDQRRA